MKKLIELYSRFISKYPLFIIFLVLLFSFFMFIQFDNLRFENQNNNDMLPVGNEVMDEFEYISDQFFDTNTITIFIEIDPRLNNSTEPRDIRDNDIYNYAQKLTVQSEKLEGVRSVESISKELKEMNDGYIPKSSNILNNYSESFEKYISEDYSSIRIILNLDENVKGENLYDELINIIRFTDNPSGLNVELSGQVIEDIVMESTFGPDMAKTGNIALLGIFIVIIFIFRSLKYGLIPLTTILFGNLWAFGLLGLFQRPITSVMTGVSSMIMGIGIDFGIQVVTRFRYELKEHKPNESVVRTMSNVMTPMLITTLAAVIGFRAMSLGNLTMMEDIGVMMSFGVLSSMLAAITVVPTLLLLFEKKNKKINTNINKLKKKIKNKK